MFTRFPIRLLNRSVFVASGFFDPEAAARMGWRAPVFALIGLDAGQKVGADFTYNASMLDVGGCVRATRSLGVQSSRRGMASRRPQPWQEVLDGFIVLDAEPLEAVRGQLQRRDSQGPRDAFAAVCAAMDAHGGESWDSFLCALEKDRFTASTWFERDRANVTLRDEALYCEVFSLWDEEVAEAIESGFLRPPARPRPSDAEWLPQLLDYAQEHGLIRSLRAEKAPGPRQRERS